MNRELLQSHLYDSVRDLPRVSCTCFSAMALCCDRPFADLAEIWFPDERKHRALRALGVPEREITGDSSDYDKVSTFLASLPRLVGTTLYEEAANDLAALGCTLAPTKENAAEIWQETTAYLLSHRISPRSTLEGNYATLVDYLPASVADAAVFNDQMLPLFAPDALMRPDRADFVKSLETVSKSCGFDVVDLKSLEAALVASLDAAIAAGCRTAVYDMSDFSRFCRPDPYHAELALQRALAGEGARLGADEVLLFRAQIMRILGRELARRGLSLLLRFSPENGSVGGPFSPEALYTLLSYLAEADGLGPTCLSFAPDQLSDGVARLLGAFSHADGLPRLYFGIAGQGATVSDLARALRFYLRHGATALCCGVTDRAGGFLTDSVGQRFSCALAAELAEWAADGAHFDDAKLLCSEARAIAFERAAHFFGFF